jgi:hypothetical protein
MRAVVTGASACLGPAFVARPIEPGTVLPTTVAGKSAEEYWCHG